MRYRARVLHVNGFDPLPDDKPEWVSRFDVNAHEGRGDMETTADPDKAFTWPSARALLEDWQAVPDACPIREDGMPNKPLTAATIMVEPVGVFTPPA